MMSRVSLCALLLAAAGCGGGTDGTPAAPPTTLPPSTTQAAQEPEPPGQKPERPGKPTGIRVVDVGTDFLVWAWDPVDGATSYVANAFPRGTPTSERPPTQVTVEPTFRADGLEPDTAMGIFVRAVREKAAGQWSYDGTGKTLPLPLPPIEITPVSSGISLTSENQIILALMAEDVTLANPLDLAGRTVAFTPDGDGYSREVRDLAWEEDLGDKVEHNEEIVFSFEFAGQQWESFFVSRYGLITFGEPYPFSRHGPDRWGTMAEIAEHLGAPPVIAALYKPRLGGWSAHDAETFGNVQHVSRRSDRVVVTWITTDPAFYVYGVPPEEKTRFQLTLHTDGAVSFHYAPEPADPDEAIRDGIVGLFPTADTSPDLYEVFHHTGVKEHLFPIGCRVIETLGDEFDAFVFHGQFRYDMQFSGSWWGYYPGNVPIRGVGFSEERLMRTSQCSTRLRGQWGFVTWTRSDFVAIQDVDGGLVPGPDGTWHFAHEFTHTWTAYASYFRDGQRKPLSDGVHWLPGLHTPAAFVRAGSLMGGSHWLENADGTFTQVVPETKEERGPSWLDLYLMGLATAEEVTATYLLRNLEETGEGWRGPHTADKETVTAEQILAALGTRDPPAARSQKVFNIGFVYLLEPGQEPDQEQLRSHALFIGGALDYWARITGGRSRLTTELPEQVEPQR